VNDGPERRLMLVLSMLTIRAGLILVDVNRTRNGTCVNRVVFVLWKERAMYGGASWALSPERASANVKMGKNLGQNTRGHRYITVPDS
jgi:hypothetical protein